MSHFSVIDPVIFKSDGVACKHITSTRHVDSPVFKGCLALVGVECDIHDYLLLQKMGNINVFIEFCDRADSKLIGSLSVTPGSRLGGTAVRFVCAGQGAWH